MACLATMRKESQRFQNTSSALDLGQSLAATFGVILCPLTPPGARTGKEYGVLRPAEPVGRHLPALGGSKIIINRDIDEVALTINLSSLVQVITPFATGLN